MANDTTWQMEILKHSGDAVVAVPCVAGHRGDSPHRFRATCRARDAPRTQKIVRQRGLFFVVVLFFYTFGVPTGGGTLPDTGGTRGRRVGAILLENKENVSWSTPSR